MGRKKVTVSLSSKSLELIDKYAGTTGLESRSRIIEEAIFSISDLLDDETKLKGVLDRFKRFKPKTYHKVPPEERKQK